MKKSGAVRILLLFGAVVIAAGVAGWAMSRPKTVETAYPRRRVVAESIAVSGALRGLVETSVGAQTSGRVARLLVREGDRVKKGQTLAQLDDAVLQAELRQAREAVSTALTQRAQADDAIGTAQAQLTLAARPALASDLARVRAETAQNVAVAQARLAGANQRLAELQRGDTLEQRQQIEAQVEQARAALNLAEKDLTRQRELSRQGAIAAATLDVAETTRSVARKTLDNLLARQKQQAVGARVEDIAQAQADIRADDATITGARATGEAQLRSLLAIPRAEDVSLAQNRVREAQRARALADDRCRESQSALEVTRRRLGDAVVTAPFDGTVTKIVTEAGGVTAPNQPLVRLVRAGRPEIRADLDEKYLGKIRVGQDAVVTADAFPGQKVQARIREIGAQIDTDRGTVEVRLDPLSTPAWLRPSQTLSVNILTERAAERLVVPLTALTTVGGEASVLVVEDGVIARRVVQAGAPAADGVPIHDGLREQDAVVAHPMGLLPGARVRAIAAPASR